MHPHAKLPTPAVVPDFDDDVIEDDLGLREMDESASVEPLLAPAPSAAHTTAFGHLVDEPEPEFKAPLPKPPGPKPPAPKAPAPKKAAAPAPLKKKRKYGPGSHGDKKFEQQRLSKLPSASGNTVTGGNPKKAIDPTHQSEHAIGYEPLSQTGNLKRGATPRARELENNAPAYQEVYQPHRDHIGTGTHGTADDSGFNSSEYRDTQRALVESGDVSSAVQVNQLGYAFDPNFRAAKDWKSDVADDSYEQMVTSMDKVEYADGEGSQVAPVTPIQQVEMLLARDAARTQNWPQRDQLAEAWAKVTGFQEDEDDAEEGDDLE